MREYIKRVETAIDELRQGRMVILTDHPDRENEGDLIFPAELITPETMNFMIKYGSGIVCLSMQAEQLRHLQIPLMVPQQENKTLRGTAFTVSIEARKNVSTGVSAADRATTILAAVKDGNVAEDIVMPGHVFPLQASEGGVLQREGHTEGSIDLCVLAGFKPASVICEIMNDDGSMACGKQLIAFGLQHQLLSLSIDDIIAYRRLKEDLIAEQSSAILPLDVYGEFKMTVIKEKFSKVEHSVLSNLHIKNNISQSPLVRMHSMCTTGDVFSSLRCDCHQQLKESLRKISQEGGILIYLNQEGRGIGLLNKMKAYHLQENGLDTIDANLKIGMPVDARSYHIAANFLRNENITSIRLLTNNPVKVYELEKFGIEIVERVGMHHFMNAHNTFYLQTKKLKLNHFIKDACHE